MLELRTGKCIVIGAGDLTISDVKAEEDDYIIAVDGGISYCELLNLEPDVIIGDFDSITQEVAEAIEMIEKEYPEKVIRLNPCKDDTDMLEALKHGVRKGYRMFHIYGATGGRLEHTFANIQCLVYLKNNHSTGYLMDGMGMLFVIQNETIKFQKSMEGYLSLFSLGKEVKGVTIQGMKYNLDNYTMTNDFPIGISNEFIGEEGLITVRDGEVVGMITYFID